MKLHGFLAFYSKNAFGCPDQFLIGVNSFGRVFPWLHLFSRRERCSPPWAAHLPSLLFRPPSAEGPIPSNSQFLLFFYSVFWYEIRTRLFRDHFHRCSLAFGQKASWTSFSLSGLSKNLTISIRWCGTARFPDFADSPKREKTVLFNALGAYLTATFPRILP